MNVLIRQLRSEWMRANGRPLEKYAGVVVLVLGTLIPIVMILMSSRNALMRKSALETLAFPASVRAARTMAMLLGPFWASAIGANVVGAEYQYGTFPWLLVRSASRLRLVIVKLLAMTARILALTLVGIGSFVVMGAVACATVGAPVISTSTTKTADLLIPFVGVGGAMAFAAVIGLTITIATRSVAFGTLTGALAQPLFLAIRFKETAPWIPYVHLQNVEERLMTGRPSAFLAAALDFHMSARASLGVLGAELLTLLAIAYLVFRRQEIVY
jgi:ABC-type transport system involved in multi-copper enzyme maturation permease subunit